jgi:putative endonuclease
MSMKVGFVDIITKKHNTTLYTGVTVDLKQRIYEHKTGKGSLFTSKYNLNKLVWFDEYPSIEEAIQREKQIKKWKRAWKDEMIREMNPDFKDLYDEI